MAVQKSQKAKKKIKFKLFLNFNSLNLKKNNFGKKLNLISKFELSTKILQGK